MNELAARREIVETALALSQSKLSPGRSGNVSRRWKNGMLVTPSGMAYDEIGEDDIVFVGPRGGVAKASRKPSSEWRFHLAIYGERADAGGVVHSHSLFATTLACARKNIPAFHYMVAVAGGGDIPLVPYATFGTEALSRNVVAGLKERNACLMANHGQIALGPTPAAALELAQEVETLAAQYVRVLSLGEVHVLDAAEMRKVVKRFKSYGQEAQKG